MPLTDEQHNGMPGMRAAMRDLLPPIDNPAQCPDPESLPSDVTVRVEIAPPSLRPHPVLDGSALKQPKPVPVFFYTLRSDQIDADVTNTRVIFFIHGGGNVAGHPSNQVFVNLYVELLRAIASHSGDSGKCVLIAPYYRIAKVPENTFPAALQDLVAAYDYVLDKGYKSSNIVIAGDSAGGNHAIVLPYLVLQAGRPSPRGVVAIAPACMQVYDHLSEQAERNASGFDTLNVPVCNMATVMYIGDSGALPADPLVSGAFIPFTVSWPRTLILVGTGDMLIDGSCELRKRIAAAGARVELVEYDGRPHGWWCFPKIFGDDIRDAVKRVAQFVLQS
ncbi:Alpha/Beta hydrolase protein [Chiua virens]|nr:Alpha/Beta hydrolase protein [Chiua virens]